MIWLDKFSGSMFPLICSLMMANLISILHSGKRRFPFAKHKVKKWFFRFIGSIRAFMKLHMFTAFIEGLVLATMLTTTSRAL
jgi:hypothetical protein